MDNKKNIILKGIVIVLAVVLCVGMFFLMKGNIKTQEKNQKTNSSVDAKLEEIRNESQIQETEEKNSETFCIYPVQKELVYSEIIEEIKKMTASTTEENGIEVLSTNYASERNKIKKYIKEQIEITVENLENKNISISYDLTKCTVTISELNGCLVNTISDKDIRNLCGLIGIYSCISYEDGSRWVVLLYRYDTLGYLTTYIFSESMGDLENQNTPENNMSTNTDAPLEKSNISDIKIKLEGN